MCAHDYEAAPCLMVNGAWGVKAPGVLNPAVLTIATVKKKNQKLGGLKEHPFIISHVCGPEVRL